MDQFNDKLRVVMEDRSRRNNLRIEGIKEMDKESWEDCERKVKDVLHSRLGLSNIDIERAHRMGKKKSGYKQPRTIIFKLKDWKQKEEILKNSKHFKGTGIYINEDFSDATNEIRKGLFAKMKKNREEGKYSIVVYDKLMTREFKSKN